MLDVTVILPKIYFGCNSYNADVKVAASSLAPQCLRQVVYSVYWSIWNMLFLSNRKVFTLQ